MYKSPKFWILSILVLVAIFILGLGTLWQLGQDGIKFSTTISNSSKRIEFSKLELADDESEQAKGLMYRKELCDKCGMLFVFPAPQNQSFWMSNTYVSLDMVFIDEQGKILNIETNTVPLQLSPTYNSNGLSKYVLEVPAGFAQRNSLQTGQILDIEQMKKDGVGYDNGYFPDPKDIQKVISNNESLN